MKKINVKTHLPKAAAILGWAVMMGPLSAQIAFASDWNPQLSERVLMLPPQHLERVVEQDFNLSPLAEELTTINDEVATKITNIQSLQDLEPQYEGEENIEVRHQIIEGKKSYIELMGTQMNLQRKRLDTKIRLYERLLEKARREQLKSGAAKTIAKLQEQAVERSRLVQSKLQEDMFFVADAEKSKFSASYEENIAAIDALKQSIKNHPMAKHAGLADNGELSSEDYLRSMIQNAQSELAVLDMEEEVLGHMAKLVVLDAMALADDLSSMQFEDEGGYLALNSSRPAGATDLFLR
jgi:hypothetical protein